MIELIYEHEPQLPFLTGAFEDAALEYRFNYIPDLRLDLNQPPDDIVYFNCVSLSTHSPHHETSLLLCEQYLEFLYAFNRTVLNGHESFEYELSRIQRYRLLKRLGVTFPPTVFSSNSDELLSMSSRLRFPATIFANRPVSEIGHTRVDSLSDLKAHLQDRDVSTSADGVLLIQEYIPPRDGYRRRAELIDGSMVATRRIAADDPAHDEPCEESQQSVVARYPELAKASHYDLVAFDYVESANGVTYTCDFNAIDFSLNTQGTADYQTVSRAVQSMVRRRMGLEL